MDSYFIDKLIYEISKKPNCNIDLFKTFTTVLDDKRNLNVLDYLPEYEWLFGNSNLI